MDANLVQRTRYILRARFRRLHTCSPELLPESYQHLLDWLDGHPTLRPILTRLRLEAPDVRDELDTTHEKWAAFQGYQPPKIGIVSRAHHASVCLAMIERLATRDAATTRTLSDLVMDFVTHLHGEEVPDRDNLGILHDDVVDVLFEYLDEHLDDRNTVHGMIEKYRQRSEHFISTELRAIGAEANEKGLARHLQLFLLDQSVDFVVEPTTRSGEPDLILRDSNGHVLVVEAKYVRSDSEPSDITRVISHGFHQTARYCQDVGESFGHLVVFNESARLLRPDLDEMDGMRYLSIGGKQVVLVEIKIGDLPSASAAGRAEDVVIPREKLIAEETVDP